MLAVASEHDEVAGTKRGPNTIFAFTLDGVRVAHFGDFGQAALRDEQAAALGAGRPAVHPRRRRPDDRRRAGRGDRRARAARAGSCPMHYRTERISFLEPADDFLARFAHVARLETPRFELGELPGERPLVVVPAAP